MISTLYRFTPNRRGRLGDGDLQQIHISCDPQTPSQRWVQRSLAESSSRFGQHSSPTTSQQSKGVDTSTQVSPNNIDLMVSNGGKLLST